MRTVNIAPFVLTLCVICSISIIDCSKKPKKRADSRESYEYKDIATGGTLIIGVGSEPDALNPLVALSKTGRDVISLVFRRLADINEDLESFSPQLAKSWSFADDGLSIEFDLRSDVLWHDGEKFTSKDVVFTYNMHKNPDVAWDGISYKENITNVEYKNDSTAVFWFKKRTPKMLMDAVEGYIVPEHLLKDIDPKEIFSCDFNRNPVGAGPFRFKEWKNQQYIKLEKNETYFIPEKPYIDNVVFKVVPDNYNLFQQLLSYDIDYMEGIPPIDFVKLQNDWESESADIRPVKYLGRQYDFIGWNLIDPEVYKDALPRLQAGEIEIDECFKPNNLFGSQKVRAALTMAIDRKRISEIVNNGLAVRMDGPVAPILKEYDSAANKIWDYDQPLAKRYLSDEGWGDEDGDGVLEKNGESFIFEMISNSGDSRREHALTLIQEQLKQIGVKMTPRVLEAGLLRRKLSQKDFDTVLIGWFVGLKMDFAPLFHSGNILSPFQFTSYSSSDFDEWEGIAKRTLDRDLSRQYWNRVSNLLSNDLPYTWLYYKFECSGIHKRFRGVTVDKRGALINVEDWWVPEEERIGRDRFTKR